MAAGESPPRQEDSAHTTAGQVPEDRATTRAPEQQLPAKPPRTRTSAAFNTLIAGAIVLILLLIFILENTQSVKVSYFGASGHLALGVLLLVAAVGGALVVGILGVARITQVRRHAKRHARRRQH